MTQEFTSFADLHLSEALLKALDELNFKTPSPIQQQAIPWLLQGRDLIGQAQTGTGKTAAFALPILQGLLPNQQGPQALILAPTRELAIQVAEHFETLSKYRPGTRVTVLCGGQPYPPQLKQLRDGVQVVVGTPGRVLDHIARGTLPMGNLSTFVLDEADEMLRMGFIEDVETILAKLPEKKQIALFASQSQKPDALLRILASEVYQGVIVFVRTKSSTEEVAEMLQQQGHRSMAIHGDLTQMLRERIISQFKQGSIDVLVATDVAARGLDVERVTHVINYDMAHDCETYVHRIGRTGRAGRTGVTILFATPKESRMLSSIERHTRQRIEKIVIPNDFTIQTAKQKQFMASISERLQHENLPAYRNIIETYLKENEVTGADVAAVLALLLNQDKPWQHEVVSLPKPVRAVKEARVRSSDSRSDQRSSRPVTSSSTGDDQRRVRDDYPQELFRIDVGRVHGVKPGNIVGAIANEAGLQSRFITGLKIHDDHSTVRLPKGMAKEVVHDLNKAWVCGRQLKLTSLGVA